ncbi:MAG: AIPR family protein [Peptococcaceae bacterium]
MSIKKTMYVKENSFRKLDDPFNDSAKKYVFYVKVCDVPEDIPMATNPRDQKLTSGVAQAIKESLESNDGYFHLKNRGIVLSAQNCTYNNKTKEVTILFSDDMVHGNIDGGHTYKIICEHRDEGLDQYVQFEVMTGVEDIIEKLAEARNTSVQVDEKSMAELQQKFDPIKEGLEGMPFYTRIAFKQNQQAFDDATNKKLKMIDAREIVAIINMFNVEKFDSVTHPIKAYSSKAKMLEMYLQNPESYRKYVNIMPDIFDLYDAIETEFADAFNNTGGRYGRRKYAGYKDGNVIGMSKFGLHEIRYKIPDGLIYPAVAAFRSLVVLNPKTDKYEWKNGVNPISVWDNCKENMTNQIMNFASAIGDNPNSVGKDSNIWNLAYMTVLLQQGIS